MEMNVKTTVEGRYRLRVYKSDGTLKKDTGEFPNLITNTGMNLLGTGTDHWRCSVGSGTATPQYTDTQLAAFLAVNAPLGVSKYAVRDVTRINDSTLYAETRFRFTFGEGMAAGNIREVGVHKEVGDDLFSRALILDEFGDPTTITILSNEYLIIDYTLRHNIPQNDFLGSVSYDGNTYDWVMRPARVTSNGSYWYPDDTPSSTLYTPFNRGCAVTSGDIGLITETPSGTLRYIQADQYSNLTYVQDSFEREVEVTLVASDGVFTGGIGAMYFRTRLNSTWQVGFTPNLPKTDSQILKVRFKHSWARA